MLRKWRTSFRFRIILSLLLVLVLATGGFGVYFATQPSGQQESQNNQTFSWIFSQTSILVVVRLVQL